MKKRTAQLLVAGLLCVTIGPTACAKEEEKMLHLFIVSGQSNMARLDPEVSFSPAVRKAFPNDDVIIVKDATGGQPIRQWYTPPKKRGKPGTVGPLYKSLMAKVKAALGDRKPTTVTFVWMQGERDAKTNLHGVYAEHLKGLVRKIKTDLKHKDMHVVIGRLSDCRNGQKGWDAIRKIQVDLSEANALWEWVDTDDLNGRKNDLHYTKKGYKTLGERFAKKAVALIKKPAK